MTVEGPGLRVDIVQVARSFVPIYNAQRGRSAIQRQRNHHDRPTARYRDLPLYTRASLARGGRGTSTERRLSNQAWRRPAFAHGSDQVLRTPRSNKEPLDLCRKVFGKMNEGLVEIICWKRVAATQAIILL